MNSLTTDANNAFFTAFKFKVPPADDPNVWATDGSSFVIYASEFEEGHIFAAAKVLLKGIFEEDDGEVIKGCMDVIKSLVESATFQGSIVGKTDYKSGKVTDTGSGAVYGVYAVSSSAKEKAKEWFTKADFDMVYHLSVIMKEDVDPEG